MGLAAQSCNPATEGQVYLDGAGHLCLLTWLGLDWQVSLLGLETQAESNLGKRNECWPQGTVDLTSTNVGWKDYKAKLPFRFQPGRYDKCDQEQTVSCLTQWGHTNYNCWASHEHSKCSEQNVDRRKGKWLVNNHDHQTQKFINFHNFNIVPYSYTVHRWTHVYKKILRRF